MAYRFKTPTVSEGPIGDHRLFWFYQQDRGVTVARYGKQIVQMRYASEDDLNDADAVWHGGNEYTVSDADAAILNAAGYGAYLTVV